MTRPLRPLILFAGLICLLLAPPARAQNPVQWNRNVSMAVDRATEQSLPLLFWVFDGREALGDEDDLADAQSECFRDPVVVGLIQNHFIPVRVSRTSNVLAEAERHGLPTSHGLYCAVLTADGRLLDHMGPDEVANPSAFASHLQRAYSRFCDDLFENQLRPLLENPATPKPQARRAVQAVYRLGIRSADHAVIGLLSRPDLTPSERNRLYDLLASLATQPAISTLLDRAPDAAAVAALRRAHHDALQWLTAELPAPTGPVLPRQFAAYDAASRICRYSASRDKDWWGRASADDRQQELDRLRARIQAVVDYWNQSEAGPR
jgi:hypothetical protein